MYDYEQHLTQEALVELEADLAMGIINQNRDAIDLALMAMTPIFCVCHIADIGEWGKSDDWEDV